MLYVSLGHNCTVNFQLQRLGLHVGSFPFNWTFTDLALLLTTLRTDFANVFDAGHVRVVFLKTGFSLRHPPRKEPDSIVKGFRERVEAFRALKEQDVTFVRFEP